MECYEFFDEWEARRKDVGPLQAAARVISMMSKGESKAVPMHAQPRTEAFCEREA